VTVISAHRFASANPRALATTRRSGFTLARRLLGKFLSARPNSFESVRARSFRRNVTMRAADECHPLPDQLHPCSRFSWFSSVPSFKLSLATLNRSQEDRCVSRRLRSLQRRNRFLQIEKCSFPTPGFLRLSCFVTRLCAARLSLKRIFSRFA